MPRFSRAIFLVLVIALAGCAASRSPEPPITVEGTVTYRGAEPFATPWLETDMRTFYVLVLDDADQASLTTPARYRMSGRVVRDSWNGIPMAHLHVSSMQRLGR